MINEAEVTVFLSALQKNHNYKYHMLAVIGLDTGLRVSDLLKLRYSDFKQNKSELVVKEQKTKKMHRIEIRAYLRAYVQTVKLRHCQRDTDLLFYGRYRNKPMDRSTVFRHFKAAAKAAGLDGIAVHSLRKTYAIEQYRASDGDLKHVSELLNHEYVETTLNHYILCNFDLESYIKQKLLG